MYKITAIIKKEGGSPVQWTHYTNNQITQKDVFKKFRKVNVGGRPYTVNDAIIDFKCEKVQCQSFK